MKLNAAKRKIVFFLESSMVASPSLNIQENTLASYVTAKCFGYLWSQDLTEKPSVKSKI